MWWASWGQFALLIGLLAILTPLLGRYMANLFQDKPTGLGLKWLESFSYRISGLDGAEEMTWRSYTNALLLFNLLGFLALFLLQCLQPLLPLNPQHFPAVPLPQAFNTAISFVTNSDWQSYMPEQTLSYSTQMLGLGVQNFLSAGTGLAVSLAFIRGITRKQTDRIGNFWKDLIRATLYLLLPLSLLLALLLISEGVIQNFAPYLEVTTLEGHTQILPMGPVASQQAINQLGSNGGGFFNANGAHPFANPTWHSNLLETLAILLIPASLVYAYGLLIGSKGHAWLLICVMLGLWAAGLGVAAYAQQLHNPVLDAYPVLEGQELRFGTPNSLIWATATTATSNGSVNAMHESLAPLAGGVALFNVILGELLFGGVGVGLCNMLMFVLLTVFLGGLMVGRTPEYMGKKIQTRDLQWVMLSVLTPPVLILVGASLAIALPSALAGISSQGPHGLTELLYAFASTAHNNGSAFAGIHANSTFYNLTLGVIMLLGRLSIIVPALALAGNLASKKRSLPSPGTLSTSTPLFAILLMCIILMVGALTFLPALSLGPIVEHFLMLKHQAF